MLTDEQAWRDATLTPAAEALAVPHAPPQNLLAVIAKAVSNPDLDVAKMERLLAMHREIVQEDRRVAFAAAMARLQAKLPQITKEGRIVVKGTERSRYARIEDIDVAIRPLLAGEGFSLSFDTESKDGKSFLISAKLSHDQGHEETKSILLPMDASDYRSNVQSIGSTVSYGKRQLIKLHLNLIERDEDDDGSGGAQPITESQAADLEAMLTEVKADKGKFLVFMGVGEVKDILARDMKKATNALEVKRRNA